MLSYLLKQRLAPRSLGLLTAGLIFSQYQKVRSDCLGIFGIVGNEGEDIAEEACLQGIKELGTLPYDACGIASLRAQAEGKSDLVITKHA